MAEIVDHNPTEPDPVIGMTLSGYRVERLMGSGGMGLVYLARHEFIDRRFAVKALKPEVAADVDMARNFHREAQVLSALKHPNIVDIVGFGALPDGRHYMVMEFLEGKTLEQEMLETPRINPERVLILADQILLALEAAHEAGVIHRDLKPSNVFLNRASGGVEVVKLLDFGLARQQPVALDGLHAVAGQTVVAGTPDYISPEQALGHQPGPGCDIYSFGVLLFELLVGQRPFDPPPHLDRTTELLRAHLESTPPTLKELGIQVPDALSELVAECLQKLPMQRPATAAEVRARLAAFRPTTPAGPLSSPALKAIQLNTLAPVSPPVSSEPDLSAAVQRRSWKGPALAVAMLLSALLGLALWPTPQPETPTPAPVEAPGVAAAPAPPPEPEPAKPALAEPEDELTGLAAIPGKKPKAPKTPKVLIADKGNPSAVGVYKSECEPDERWRTASRVHLQELQGLAAGDDARWSEFERLEPSLSLAITNASNGEQCDAVEQQIRRLAIKWKK